MLVIEGQIGVGKTTLGTILSERLNIPLFQEINKKQTLDLLDKFYSDPQRWGFSFQIHFLNERFRMIKEIFHQGEGILDRSLYGDCVFADMLHQKKIITSEEYEIYLSLLCNMLDHVQNPTLLIYLDCSVETDMNRIQKRSRGIESNISRDYLEDLNNRYLQWYNEYKYSPKIFLDYNHFDINDSKSQNELLDIIKPYL